MTEPEPGTVIYVRRSFVAAIADIISLKIPEHFPCEYRHYGVYAGNDKVIHFAKRANDGRECIHQAPLEEFLEKQPISDLHVKHFPQNKKALEIILKNRNANSSDIARALNAFDSSGYHFYSAKETLRRAKSCINDPAWSYSALGNNCEHFACWCKTGIKYSAQVEDFLDIILG